MLGEQLAEVFVRRDDHHIGTVGLRLAGEAPDDIVGLDARRFEDGQVEGVDDLLDPRQVEAQIVRHGRTVGLVVGVHLAPERLAVAARVEDDGEVLHPVVVDELEERVGEAERRARVLALAVDERAGDEDEVAAVGERHRVEQVQRAARGGGRW